MLNSIPVFKVIIRLRGNRFFIKFYKIKKSKKNGTNELNTGIVTLDQVQQSIHLIPVFPKNSTNTLWTSETVLDLCDTFFINN